MSFLPSDYKEPQRISKYMRLQEGDNTFRILSSAITGWEWWIDVIDDENKKTRKPIRIPMDKKVPADQINNSRHFWAFIIYNYDAGKVQILEITQKTIQRMIMALINNPRWGDPKEYDITITKVKTGEEDRDVDYQVTPNPKELFNPPDVKNINLAALYVGEDPFADYETSEKTTSKKTFVKGKKTDEDGEEKAMLDYMDQEIIKESQIPESEQIPF